MWWVVLLGTWLIRLLGCTWRWEAVNLEARDRLRRDGTPVLLAFWHAYILPVSLHVRDRGYRIMISEHKDGEIIAKIHERWGNLSVRGSTSRGGGRALLAMVRVLQDGHDGVITPDGPRGPAGVAQPGALMASARSGVPILGLRVEASRAWRLKSWDRFMVPKPFATVRVIYEDPWVAPDASEESLRELERRLGPALPAVPRTPR